MRKTLTFLMIAFFVVVNYAIADDTQALEPLFIEI